MREARHQAAMASFRESCPEGVDAVRRSADSVPGMFDRIAGRYDLLNRLLSGRRDVAWRKRLAAALPSRPDVTVLDVATGTGDVLATIVGRVDSVTAAVGIDPAPAMLAIAERKLHRERPRSRVRLLRAEAENLPFQACSFDVVTVAFGVRNMTDLARALTEMRRVLRPGGAVCILEFSLPRRWILRMCYLGYLRHVLPRVGGLISGDGEAYRYLGRTVEQFPCPEAFVGLMKRAGFDRMGAEPLTGGIATLYRGFG